MHFSIIVSSIRGFRGYVFPSKFTICTHFYTRASFVKILEKKVKNQKKTEAPHIRVILPVIASFLSAGAF